MRRAALPLLLLRIFLATWLAPIRLASAWVSRNGRRSTSALRSSTPAAADDDAWLEAIVSARNSLERKAQSLQRESDKAQKAEELRQLADLWTSNLYLFQNGARSASAWDLEGQPVQLTLEEEYSSASDYVASLYEQARKRSRAVSITEERLEETQRALERLEELRGDWEAVVIDNPSACRIVQDQLLQSASLTGFQAPQETPEVSNKPKFQPQQPKVGSPASNVRKLTTPGGCVVLVGRNRRGNEYLTFQVARGNDVWMQYVLLRPYFYPLNHSLTHDSPQLSRMPWSSRGSPTTAREPSRNGRVHSVRGEPRCFLQ